MSVFSESAEMKIFPLDKLVHSDETPFKEDYDDHICELNGSILYPWKYEKYLTPADYRILCNHLLGNGHAPWRLSFRYGIETPFRLCVNHVKENNELDEPIPSSLQDGPILSSLQDALNYLMSPTDVVPLSELFNNPEFRDAVEDYIGCLNRPKSTNFVPFELFHWAKFLTGDEYRMMWMFLYNDDIHTLPINIYENQNGTMTLFNERWDVLLPMSRDYVPTQDQIDNFVERWIECINSEIPMVVPYINFYSGMKIRVLNFLREQNTRDKRDEIMIRSIIDDYKKVPNITTAEKLEIIMVEMFNCFYQVSWH